MGYYDIARIPPTPTKQYDLMYTFCKIFSSLNGITVIMKCQIFTLHHINMQSVILTCSSLENLSYTSVKAG